jgi:hypothetical protein
LKTLDIREKNLMIPPSPPYEKGEKIKKAPLFKGDLGGSKLFKQPLRTNQNPNSVRRREAPPHTIWVLCPNMSGDSYTMANEKSDLYTRYPKKQVQLILIPQ